MRATCNDRSMSTFTDAEIAYLQTQRLARLATASATGQPDVSPVTFGLDGEAIVSGGFDITKTVRYRHLSENPHATIVIDDLASVDPWTPRGVKVRGSAALEEHDGGLRIRIVPEVIWSWGLNEGADKHFKSIERRTVERTGD
jgi:pyridoxamine 5'-phosphate oxidase family protein